MRRFLPLLVLPLLLSACVTAVVTSATEVGVGAAENRSAGRTVDDKVLYGDVMNQYLKSDNSRIVADVTANVRFGRVMLTGRVKNEEEAQQAVSLTWKAGNVEEVINELIVDTDSTNIWNTANDSLIKRNLEARLLITKDVYVINYSIDVQNGIAYLLGRVKDEGELNRALNVARTTRGVKRVVSHLQISTDEVLPTAPPHAGQGAGGITDSSKPPAPVTNYSVPPGESHIPPPSNGPIPQDSTRPAALDTTAPAPDSITSGPVGAPAGGY